MPTYPSDIDVDTAFPDNTAGDISAEDMRTFQKSMTAAGKDYTALTENVPSEFPPAAHTHPTSEVTGLDTALAGKAPTVHTHTTAQVTGLDAALQAQDDATSDLEGQVGVLNFRVVEALPGTPDADTIYFVTG